MFYKKVLIFTIIFIQIFNISILADEIDEENIEDLSSLETSSSCEIPIISSTNAIAIDRTSKKILYGKNEFDKTAMASTTKIMTAIIALENSNLNDIVSISKNAAKTSGSTLGVKPNQKITIENLLYGLLLCSGNDCAVAIAEYIGKDLKGFAKLMNQKAQELNLLNTNFVTPHGLDNELHFTTAYDLALLTNYALKNEIFKKIVGTKSYTITIDNFSKKINNTNELLGYLEGVYGVKTGYTSNAGRCLVTACSKNNLDIIVVVLGAGTKKQRTQDSINIINYIYKNFEIFDCSKLISSDFENFKNNYNLTIKNSNSLLSIELENLETYLIPIKKSELGTIKTQIYSLNYINAPLENNTQIGVLQVISSNKILLNQKIFLSNDIKKLTIFEYYVKILKKIK